MLDYVNLYLWPCKSDFVLRCFLHNHYIYRFRCSRWPLLHPITLWGRQPLPSHVIAWWKVVIRSGRSHCFWTPEVFMLQNWEGRLHPEWPAQHCWACVSYLTFQGFVCLLRRIFWGRSYISGWEPMWGGKDFLGQLESYFNGSFPGHLPLALNPRAYSGILETFCMGTQNVWIVLFRLLFGPWSFKSISNCRSSLFSIH